MQDGSKVLLAGGMYAYMPSLETPLLQKVDWLARVTEEPLLKRQHQQCQLIMSR
jgi:hypothetical protein